MRRLLSFAIVLLFVSISSAQTIEQILSSGPTGKRIDLVFLSEGYTQSQLPQFILDAKRMLGSILAAQPYAEYRSFFNAFAISVASNESGSDHPSRNEYHDTYFNSTFEVGGITRLIGLTGDGYQRAMMLLQNLMPEYDHVIMIVNDPEYGGSGGGISITSTNADSPEVVIHEFGHSMAALADEYSSPIPNPPGGERINATQETRRDFISWKMWIDSSTPIPTPETSEHIGHVGLFEGAYYRSTGWYRPQLSCKMRSLGSSFCAICSEAIIHSIFSTLRPIELYEPRTLSLAAYDTSSIEFTTTSIEPATHRYRTQWLVDGIVLSTDSSHRLQIDAKKLSIGNHTVTFELIDTTFLVRRDQRQLLTDRVQWYLTLMATTVIDDLHTPSTPRASLLSIYPNPSASTTTILFRLMRPACVRIELFDLLGRVVSRVADDEYQRGTHTVTVDAARVLSSQSDGLYFCRLTADGVTATRTMLLLSR